MDKNLTIVSGGQTGVDRAALDAALEAGLSCGGWCPLGHEAEDGPIASRYRLREAASPDPARITGWLRDEQVQKLNVAGPRESEAPGMYDAAHALLSPLFAELSAQSPSAETGGRKPIVF